LFNTTDQQGVLLSVVLVCEVLGFHVFLTSHEHTLSVQRRKDIILHNQHLMKAWSEIQPYSLGVRENEALTTVFGAETR
jgi:hypothetical protein